MLNVWVKISEKYWQHWSPSSIFLRHVLVRPRGGSCRALGAASLRSITSLDRRRIMCTVVIELVTGTPEAAMCTLRQ